MSILEWDGCTKGPCDLLQNCHTVGFCQTLDAFPRSENNTWNGLWLREPADENCHTVRFCQTLDAVPQK